MIQLNQEFYLDILASYYKLMIKKETEELILKLYQLDNNIEHVHQQSSVCIQTIRRVLKLHNVRIRTAKEFKIASTRIISPETTEKIISLYKSNFSPTRISEICETGITIIKRILKSSVHNVEYRTITMAHQAYHKKRIIDQKINIHAFKNLTEESCYWLGMLATDGNVFKNCIKLYLQASDIDVIQKFKLFLNSNNKIINNTKQYQYKNIKKTTTTYGISITNKEMAQDLFDYGIIPKKSLVLKINNYDLLNSKDFWRGCIDGDGSVLIRTTKNTTGTITHYPSLILSSASLEFIQQAKNYFQPLLFSINHKFDKEVVIKGTKYYSIAFHGEKAYLLIQYLYENAAYYLNRKKETADKIIKLLKNAY